MIYIIRGYENYYSGLHGFEMWEAVEGDLKAAEFDAVNLSYYVMDSYNCIAECLREDAEYQCENPEDEDEWNEAYEEALEGNVAYSIWQVNDNCPFDLKEIDKRISEDPEEFVEEYCTLVVCC